MASGASCSAVTSACAARRCASSVLDPDYLSKEARLLACLQTAATKPAEVALVFLDEMGYYRWGDAAEVWCEQAPAPRPETERAEPNNQQWRLIGALNACSGRVD